MRTILLLLGKDLRRKMRSPVGLLVVLSFPLVFAGMIALVFGSKGDRIPRVHLLVENRDDGFVSGFLVSALTSKRLSDYFQVETVGAEGAALMERGKASALLRIPERFTRDLLEGKPTSISLVRNPAQGILPEIAEQLAGALADALDSASRVLGKPLTPLRPILDAKDGEDVAVTDAMITDTSLAIKRAIEGTRKVLFPPVITLEGLNLGSSASDARMEVASGATQGARNEATAGSAAKDPRTGEANESKGGAAAAKPKKNDGTVGAIFLFVLPGIAVYALFLVGDLAMRDLLAERAAGTLRRQLAGPIDATTVLLGKAAYTAVLAILAIVVIAAFGLAVLDRPVNVAGFVLLAFALVLAVVGASSTIYGFASSERQGATVGAIVYLVLGMAGGSFLPLEALPVAVRAVAPVSPFYWGSRGFRTLLQDGGNVAAVAPHAGVLATLGAVLLAAGAWLLARRMKRGAA